ASSPTTTCGSMPGSWRARGRRLRTTGSRFFVENSWRVTGEGCVSDPDIEGRLPDPGEQSAGRNRFKHRWMAPRFRYAAIILGIAVTVAASALVARAQGPGPGGGPGGSGGGAPGGGGRPAPQSILSFAGDGSRWVWLRGTRDDTSLFT